MSQSTSLVDSETIDSTLSARYSHQSFEQMSLFNQLQKQQQLNQFQQSPSSVGSLKASPPIYHSPQINQNRRKVSKFMNENGFSPALKNRILTQGSSTNALVRGSNTPSSLFKLTENSKDSPNIDSDRKLSSRQNIIQANFFNPQLLKNIEKNTKKEEGISLPLIDPSQSIQKVKNKLSLLEDKQSFFKELNKYTRKSFCTQPAISDNLKSGGNLPEGPSIQLINPISNRDMSTTESSSYLNQTSLKTIHPPTNSLTLQIKKSPQLIPSSRPSIFQESSKDLLSYIKLEGDQKQSPFKTPSLTSTNHSSSQLNNFNKLSTPSKGYLFNDNNSAPSINFLSQPKSRDTPMKKSPVVFNYSNVDDSNQIQTLSEINNDTNPTNQNTKQNTNQQIQKKESNEIHSSQTFSSEEEGSQTLISQINTNPVQKKGVINLRKMSQMDSIEVKGFFSPQINQGTTIRRRQTQAAQLSTMSSLSQKFGTPLLAPIESTDKESVLASFQNGKLQKSDRFMSLFQGSFSLDNNPTQQQSQKSSIDRSTIMREFYYLLPDIKKYVTDEIEKDYALKQDIYQFYMIQDLHEFSFHFGQFLDHLAEQRQLTEKTFPYKFPKKIFSKINNFMHIYVSKQPQNSEQMLKLLDEQISKSIHIIMPSTLLEGLGGYCKVRSISESVTKMLYSSALANHIIMHPEEKSVNKVEEFLLAALQQDFNKTKTMIEEFKKYSGSGFTCAEFYVLKQILFNFFGSHTYYSEEVKYSFFELLESLRYQLTQEEGFSQSVLEAKQEALMKELQFIWKQDPILSKLKESSKNSSVQFIQVLFDFAFSQKNCYQVSKSFYDNFVSGQLDILVVKSLHQMVKVATKRQSISQHNLQMNFNYLFKKLQWFISKDNANYVSVLGDYKSISDQMQFIILNQKFNSDSPTVQSPTKENNVSDIENTNKGTTKPKKFRLLTQYQQSNQQSSSLQKQSPSSGQPLSDISNFSQFLALFFNFYTTFQYPDLVCLFKSEKGIIEIFQFWTQIFSEALVETRNVQVSTANEIKKFIQDLFEFQLTKSQQ